VGGEGQDAAKPLPPDPSPPRGEGSKTNRTRSAGACLRRNRTEGPRPLGGPPFALLAAVAYSSGNPPPPWYRHSHCRASAASPDAASGSGGRRGAPALGFVQVGGAEEEIAMKMFVVGVLLVGAFAAVCWFGMFKPMAGGLGAIKRNAVVRPR